MSGLPVLYFHVGWQPYLAFAIAQARVAMPASRLILLGDQASVGRTMAEHFSFSGYSRAATAFSRHYRHFSSNPPAPELGRFQRWYAFLELMDELALPEALICDSDVMLFHDFSSLPDELPEVDCGLGVPLLQDDCRWVAGPQVAYWKREALREFCEFNMRFFKDNDERLPRKWQWQQENRQAGGVGDQTALHLFYESLPENRKMNFLKVHDQAVVDGNIGSPENYLAEEFLMADGVKKVSIRQNQPYGYHLPGCEEVRFLALHFQGINKWLMPRFYQGRSPRLLSERWQVLARYGLRYRMHRLAKVFR